MLIYDIETKKSVYFIHIPRTGGRYINTIFKNNQKYLTLFANYSQLYLDKDVPHLTYPHYNNLKYPNYHEIIFNIKEIPHFTIVRNPFDRFVSSVKFFIKNNEDLNEILDFTKEQFLEKINHYNKYSSNNWFVPQHLFISPQTKIYKYEDGFGEKFKVWMDDNFNFNLKYTKNKYYKKIKNEDKIKKYQIFNLYDKKFKKINSIIEEIYIEDYNKFFYETSK